MGQNPLRQEQPISIDAPVPVLMIRLQGWGERIVLLNNGRPMNLARANLPCTES
jgi:hypothetical protein